MNRELLKVIGVFAVIAGVIFAPAFNNFLLSDSLDWVLIGQLANFPDYFLTNYTGIQGPGSYRPLITLVFSLLSNLSTTSTELYHAVSVVMHAVNSVLVWVLTRQLFAQKKVAWGAGLLFLVMPIHAEVVLWVAGYPDLFATAGMLGSATMFVHWLRGKKWSALVWSLLFWIVALLSKESAIVMPGVFVLLYGVIRQGIAWKEFAQWVVPTGVLGVVYLAVRQFSLSGLGSYSVSATQITVQGVFETLSQALVVPLVWSLEWQAIVAPHAAAVVVVLMLAGLYFYRKTFVVIGLLLVAYIGIFAPALILQFAPQSSEGERLVYTASIAMCMAIAYVIVQMFGCKKYNMLLLALLFVVSANQWGVKHKAYASAAETVEYVFEQSEVLLEENSAVKVLIGLPENNTHAPLLRNGFIPGLRLQNPDHQELFLRAPIYQKAHTCRPLTWERVDNGWLSSPSVFSGPDVYQHKHLSTELWEYDYENQVGGFIKILLREDESQIAALRDGVVEYWYWDCQKWQQLTEK